MPQLRATPEELEAQEAADNAASEARIDALFQTLASVLEAETTNTPHLTDGEVVHAVLALAASVSVRTAFVYPHVAVEILVRAQRRFSNSLRAAVYAELEEAASSKNPALLLHLLKSLQTSPSKEQPDAPTSE